MHSLLWVGRNKVGFSEEWGRAGQGKQPGGIGSTTPLAPSARRSIGIPDVFFPRTFYQTVIYASLQQ